MTSVIGRKTVAEKKKQRKLMRNRMFITKKTTNNGSNHHPIQNVIIRQINISIQLVCETPVPTFYELFSLENSNYNLFCCESFNCCYSNSSNSKAAEQHQKLNKLVARMKILMRFMFSRPNVKWEKLANCKNPYLYSMRLRLIVHFAVASYRPKRMLANH